MRTVQQGGVLGLPDVRRRLLRGAKTSAGAARCALHGVPRRALVGRLYGPGHESLLVREPREESRRCRIHHLQAREIPAHRSEDPLLLQIVAGLDRPVGVQRDWMAP